MTPDSSTTGADTTGSLDVHDNLVAPALVRILDQEGRHFGFGLLLAPGKVVTCAHVVARSMGEDDVLQKPPPRRRVRLDFPFVAEGRVLTAGVSAWRPMAADGGGDVAGLELDDDVPPGARPLAMTRGGQIGGHEILAYGYQNPGADAAPTWVPGVVVERTEQGWLQLGMSEATGGLRIREGFSGTPVWDVQNGQVVGLVNQSYLRRDMWLAYAITGETVFDAWPELRESFRRTCPFRSLVPFEPADQHLFFGREELSGQAIRRISGSDHTLITGASGAGKTSLVRAAVIPALEREGHAVLTVRAVSRDSLWKTLAAALAARVDPTFGTQWLRMEEMLGGAFAADRLASRINRLCDVLGNDRVVIVFDQFEEFLRRDDQRAREFVAELGRLSSIRHPEGRAFVRLVIVVRDDLEAVLRALPPFDASTLEVVRVGPMTQQQLREAVQGPVRQTAFVRYEDKLVERIIDDIHVQPYSLPALQVILTSLWERQTSDGLLRLSVYQELNQGAGPLSTHLERVWHELGHAEQGAARRLFLHLVVPLSAGSFARRIASRSEVGADGWQVASVLATHRLVVLRGTPTGDATMELVHDALIEQWPTLAQHLAAHRDFLQWREDLRRRMAMWQQAQQQESQLLTGAALNLGLRQLEDRQAELAPQEQHFLTLSRQRQQKLRRRTGMSIVAVLSVVAIAVAASVLAVMRNRAADLAEREDLSRRLAAQSEAVAEANPVLSSLLAAAAWQTAHTAQARYSMRAVVHRPNRGILDGHTETTYGVAFSPDGKVLATTGGHNDGSSKLSGLDGLAVVCPM